MSLRWLSKTVSGGRSFGVRRRVAPEAQRDLSSEIDAHVVPVLRAWRRDLILGLDEDAEPERTVIAWLDADARPDVAAWLADVDADDASPPSARTDWLFLPAVPEAILMVVVGENAELEGRAPFRFNLRLAADPYRRHLTGLAKTGQLGLTAEPLEVGPARELLSPCVFVPVQTGPLRQFLRELPPLPVV
ncbi:MAG: hypothetical protein U0893_22065 [Chloroflexota bacterium]